MLVFSTCLALICTTREWLNTLWEAYRPAAPDAEDQDVSELRYQLQTAVLLTLCGPVLQFLSLCLSDLQVLEKALQQRQGKLWAVQLLRQLL